MGRTKYITPKFTRSKISDVKATLYLYFHFLLCECLYNFSSHCYDPRKSYKYCIIWSLESQPSKAKCKPLSTTALFWCSVLLLWGHLGSDETGGKLKALFATEMMRERTVYQEKKLKFLSWPTFGASVLPKAAWSCLLPMKDRTNNPMCTSGCRLHWVYQHCFQSPPAWFLLVDSLNFFTVFLRIWSTLWALNSINLG